MDLETIKRKTIPILRRHGIVKAAVFGSYARGEQNKSSDIDILIEYAPGSKKTLFDLVDLRNELKKTLQKEIDLATERSLSRNMREIVLREKKVIL